MEIAQDGPVVEGGVREQDHLVRNPRFRSKFSEATKIFPSQSLIT